MLDPELVRDCCAAIQAASSVPVTVKCRLGVDEVDSYEAFRHFVTTVASAGVSHFVVHARKCWLNGLNPHENRTVPPLRHEWVYKLAYELPELTISLNGGVESIDTAVQMLSMTREDGGKYVDALPAMPTFSEAKREAKAAVVASKAKKERPRAESTENDAALSCEGCGEVPASTKHDTSSESVLHGPPRLTADPSTVGTGLLGSVMIGRFAYNQPWAFW
jgi:tRNA-dihydrouridine synthase